MSTVKQRRQARKVWFYGSVPPCLGGTLFFLTGLRPVLVLLWLFQISVMLYGFWQLREPWEMKP